MWSAWFPLTRTGVIFENFRALENKKSDAAISLIDFQLERGENAITIMRAAFIPTLRICWLPDFYVTHST